MTADESVCGMFRGRATHNLRWIVRILGTNSGIKLNRFYEENVLVAHLVHAHIVDLEMRWEIRAQVHGTRAIALRIPAVKARSTAYLGTLTPKIKK